jgi:large subunit ribosomal protein L29
MTIKELRAKPINELQALLNEKRESLRAMRFKVAQRQLKKVHDVKNTRRDIARILTILKEKQRKL